MKTRANRCLVFLGILAAAWPALLGAQSNDTEAFTQEFLSLLTHRNDTTEVTLEQCTLTIQIRFPTSCAKPTDQERKVTTIDLREIKEMELRPFDDGFVLDFDMDVPLPSRLKTLAIRTSEGRAAAFEFFRTEADRLLSETELTSNQGFVSCTGKISKLPKSRSIMLFLNEEPATWGDFEKIVENCN